MQPEEDAWVNRLKGPDREAAIKELRALLVKGLQRSLGSRNSDPSFSEDVAQEALIKILDALDAFEGRSKFTTWAMTIATRHGISELRRRHTRNISLDSITQSTGWQVASDGDAAPQAEKNQERDRVMKTLQRLIDERLSDKQRFALQALLSGLPVEQIAERTGSNRNAVYKLVHDARKRLRIGFEESGIASEDISNLFV